MAILIKSFENLVEEFRTYLKAAQSVDTTVGTVSRDVLVDLPATINSETYANLDELVTKFSLEDPDAFTETELDSYAENYGIARIPAQPSSGFVTFVRTDTVLEDTIPIGTEVTTNVLDSGKSYTFVTKSNLIFAVGNATGTVSIECTDAGLDTNVGADTIVNTALDYSVVNNDPTTGGTDTETNANMMNRIKNKFKAINQLTINGLSEWIGENFETDDVSIISPGDVEMVRDIYGGSIDVYIRKQLLTNNFETYTKENMDYDEENNTGTIVLENQPINEVISVIETKSNGDIVELVANIDYTFSKDINLINKNSSNASDKVIFYNYSILSGTSTFKINYAYNEIIQQVQDFLNDPANHILTTDVVIYNPEAVLIDIGMEIGLFPGYDAAAVKIELSNSIVSYINSLKMGSTVDQSDIVSLVHKNEAVDKVEVPLTNFNIVGYGVENTLSIDRTKYFQINGEPLLNI